MAALPEGALPDLGQLLILGDLVTIRTLHRVVLLGHVALFWAPPASVHAAARFPPLLFRPLWRALPPKGFLGLVVFEAVWRRRFLD